MQDHATGAAATRPQVQIARSIKRSALPSSSVISLLPSTPRMNLKLSFDGSVLFASSIAYVTGISPPRLPYA